MRRYFLIRLFICILLLLMLLPFYCYCEESVYDFSDLLPEYSENSTFEKAKETVTNLQNYLKPPKILDLLSGNLISFGKSTFLSFGICFSLILCYGVLSSIKSGFSQNDSGFEFIANLIFICVAFSPLSLCFTKVTNHIYASCGYMLSFVPVSAALYAASGNTLTASGSTVTFQSAILATELISCSVILPLSKAICVLTTVNAVNRRLNFTGLCSFLKSLCLWIMGLCFTMFTGLLSLQTILNSACDNLAMKGLRYSASKLIPIAGGLISDSMRTVISSVCFIKSAGGFIAIVAFWEDFLASDRIYHGELYGGGFVDVASIFY